MLLLLRRPHRNIMSFCAFEKFWKPTTDTKRGGREKKMKKKKGKKRRGREKGS
jgi:hypothetical protein